MFNFEKIFQNSDTFFIKITLIFEAFILYLSVYIFSILELNSIYDLLNIKIYQHSDFFIISFYLPIIYLIICFFKKRENRYKENFLSFLTDEVYNLFSAIIITFALGILIKTQIDEIININFIYLLFFILFNLFLCKKITNYLYQYLINKNIIQRNIMLVGTTSDIMKIISENLDKINIYKCCLIDVDINTNIDLFRKEVKIPVFYKEENVRSILEYHSLGQIWILDNNLKNIEKLLNIVLKFSIDILIIDLNIKPNLTSRSLINNKYQFEYYEISKFHGFNLFIKIIIDKILAVFFLLLLCPVIILSLILLYLEDGFPLFFTQDRTGWDGRRFRVYKIRSLIKGDHDTRDQVIINDLRILKTGKFIRRFSIDEVPQFFNVLIGNMSIVGPRPHPVDLDIKYSQLLNGFLKRHKSSPGLTGWAQVNGFRGGTPTVDLMKKRMVHDLWYLNNWTIMLDIYIIFKTFYVIFKKPKK